MTLLEALQQINTQSMDAAQLTDMCVGTVVSVSPLEVEIDVHQAPLNENVLILTDAVKEKVIDTGAASYFEEINGVLCAVWGSNQRTEGSAVVIRPLAVGDKVLMLSVKHGQQFIILSRL